MTFDFFKKIWMKVECMEYFFNSKELSGNFYIL